MSPKTEKKASRRSIISLISEKKIGTIRGGGVGGGGSLPQIPNLGTNLRTNDPDDDGVLPKK